MGLDIKWHEAYYPLLDRPITVNEALQVRRENCGEYRENPCYNSKNAYEEGLGIQLTPVDNSTNPTINFFRAFPGQSQIINEIANSVGILGSSSTKYTQSAVRVKSVIELLATQLESDKIAKDSMFLLSVNASGEISSINHPDIIIRHLGEYSRSETRAFIQDVGRKPQYSELVDDWFLDITKFAPEVITSWDALRPLFMAEWKRAENKARRKLAELDSEEHFQEVRGMYDEIILDSSRSIFVRTNGGYKEYISSEHPYHLKLFELEILRRLENGSISILVANSARTLYHRENKSATWVDGNGIRREWNNGSELSEWDNIRYKEVEYVHS